MNSRGFSLIELSIVLVILGLLTGGILAGQSLIRAAEMRATIAQGQRYLTAVQSFQGRYFGWPGDLVNATTFWGTAAACPGTSATPSTTAATCNGDGDGRLATVNTGNTSSERFRAWQHLANAGLIEGSYSGVMGPAGTNDGIVGVNTPKGRMSNSGWGFSDGAAIIASDPINFVNNFQNHFVVGSQKSGAQPSGLLMKPEEAWNLDTKLDDGLPAMGVVMAIYWASCTNATGATDTASVYKLTDTSIGCALRIKIN